MNRFAIVTVFALTLFVLPGCQKPVEVIPVPVDRAAAFPEQEPKTRPPILKAEKLLTPKELDQGYVQLFDGVSTYGWRVENGNENNFFVGRISDDDSQGLAASGECSAVHNFAEIRINFGNLGKMEGTPNENAEWSIVPTKQITRKYKHGVINSKSKPICTAIDAIPKNMQPLAEADWKPATEPAQSVWEDGVLTLTGGSGMVESVKEYGDFILQLEYLTEPPTDPTEPGINSGVFFRCIPGEKMNGYECQILNKAPEGDYEKFIGTDTGGIFRRCVGRNVDPKDGEWNYLTIAAKGPKVATWVNGIQVTDWTDTRDPHANPRNGLRLEPGTIQLQGHDPGTKIQFRNFRIAEMKGQ